MLKIIFIFFDIRKIETAPIKGQSRYACTKENIKRRWDTFFGGGG